MPTIRDRVIKGDSKYVVDYITDAHDAYKYYINRWTFLGDSFNGCYDFFAGRYLEPYYYESRDDYEKRLRMLGLDNHVKSVVNIYNSFLYRKRPKRMFGSIENDPSLEPFLNDADLDGRSFDAFMRDTSSYAMVYGHVWVVVDKPNAQAFTRADELDQEIRPYVSLFTPDNVLDWGYERQTNGLYKLTYLKVKEEILENQQYIREYTPTEVNVYAIDGDDNTGDLVETLPNELGRVPAVCVYAQRSNVRGVGISPIADIADLQKQIYEFNSEIDQIIRLTNHPTLVKSVDTEASAGAGSIVQMPQGMDPGLKPYLLQPDGASIESVLNTITQKVDAIDRMANLGGIRSVESRRLSGISLQTEFQMLNSKLADFAMNLEHAEEQIWRLWAIYQDARWDGEIEYPRTFSIQDKANDVNVLKMAKEANLTNTYMQEKIDRMIFQTVTEKDWAEIDEMIGPMKQYGDAPSMDQMIHAPVTSSEDLVKHLREMINAGYNNEQIMQLHPELNEIFESESDDDDNG